MTKAAVKGLVGQGLIGVARDNFGRKGNTQAWVAAFAEVEVDVETGEYTLVDYVAATDCGVVVNPRGLAGQLHGGGVQGFARIIGNGISRPRGGVILAPGCKPVCKAAGRPARDGGRVDRGTQGGAPAPVGRDNSQASLL